MTLSTQVIATDSIYYILVIRLESSDSMEMCQLELTDWSVKIRVDGLIFADLSHEGQMRASVQILPFTASPEGSLPLVFLSISMESRKTRNENWGAEQRRRRRRGSRVGEEAGPPTEVILPSLDSSRDDFVASCRRLMGL